MATTPEVIDIRGEDQHIREPGMATESEGYIGQTALTQGNDILANSGSEVIDHQSPLLGAVVGEVIRDGPFAGRKLFAQSSSNDYSQQGKRLFGGSNEKANKEGDSVKYKSLLFGAVAGQIIPEGPYAGCRVLAQEVFPQVPKITAGRKQRLF